MSKSELVKTDDDFTYWDDGTIRYASGNSFGKQAGGIFVSGENAAKPFDSETGLVAQKRREELYLEATEEGVAPSYSGFDNDESKVVWKFEDGYLEAGDHSWLLVFSSDQSWVEGNYEIEGVENPFPVAPASNPEPATLLLLTAGGGLLLTKRNKLKGRGK